MSKRDRDFVNTDPSQEYELKDWLERNEFSRSAENVKVLKEIINEKLKKKSSDNITWQELDNVLSKHPDWFSSLVKPGK